MFAPSMPGFNSPQNPSLGGGLSGGGLSPYGGLSQMGGMDPTGALPGIDPTGLSGLAPGVNQMMSLEQSQAQMCGMMVQMMMLIEDLMMAQIGQNGASGLGGDGSGDGDGVSEGGGSPGGDAGSVGSTGSASPTSAIVSPTASDIQKKVSSFAQAQEGKPYVFGAAGPGSFDCSGLALKAWEQVGTKLPHNANAQYQALPKVPISQAQAGDLVFFSGSDGNSKNPGHVGIVIDPVKHLMVSASTDGVPLKDQIPVQNYMDEKGVYATVRRPVAGKSYT